MSKEVINKVFERIAYYIGKVCTWGFIVGIIYGIIRGITYSYMYKFQEFKEACFGIIISLVIIFLVACMIHYMSTQNERS